MNKKLQKKGLTYQSVKNVLSGFTLVELIVSVGLFTAVIFVATGALLSVVALNKKAQAQQSAINNLNFALENIARSIRTGSNYRCNLGVVDRWDGTSWQDVTPNDCDSNTAGGNQIIFESESGDGGDNNDNWSYYLENSTIIAKKKGNSANAITAPEIFIEDIRFFVTGATVAGGTQPMVRIVLKGYAFVGDTNTDNPRRVDFNLQTIASQRKLDV